VNRHRFWFKGLQQIRRGSSFDADLHTIREIAVAERINEFYVGRVLRLTLLAPKIIEGISRGRQPSGPQLDELMKPFPIEWHAQEDAFRLII
jgi:hypothetical protein